MYPHSIVSDNAAGFISETFKQFCRENGIIHLPATNKTAEKLIQILKKALRNSSVPSQKAALST